jgi:hypothetical protein
MAVDEKKKLYDAIGYADDNTKLNYPEEVCILILFNNQHLNFSMSILIYLFN